jgi:hypothetical protein
MTLTTQKKAHRFDVMRDVIALLPDETILLMV